MPTGICNKLKYGSVQKYYMPKFDKFCCPGYEQINDECLPRCDLGCPRNSHCVSPNICGCDLGYEIDEIYTYYGREMIKSCQFERGAIYLIIIILTITVSGIALCFYIKCFRGKQKTSSPCIEDGENKETSLALE
ncbi:uncharacterized protein LOC133850586 [Drosophila sulfurigaster albostrigata]|uniref:uncharacterized protein LOC133850586 n=1 Tax=Drosophila sulfurigaster albostrigata TaxID=89887 RepID=UPI002D21C8B5|nr:uncharacterized protein LOC133850586 [Drosophila sulfurigaster albostrigata]